jgi:hypothetical protein
MREPLLIVACGKKGVGKSYQHNLMMQGYVMGDPYRGIRPRKCLILDVNDEYGVYGIRALSLEDVALYTIHPYIEIRRIRPFHPNGSRMTLDEWANAVFYVLNTFKNGLLLIEDPNKWHSDHLPADLVGAICTNRHVGLDILLSYQSIGRINTKIWGNTNLMRFHKNTESVERHKNKFPDKEEYMKIAENMVNNEYLKGNKRFFVYVDMDEEKIRGDFSKEIYEQGVDDYINERYRELVKPYLVQVDAKGKKLYDMNTARNKVKERIMASYVDQV